MSTTSRTRPSPSPKPPPNLTLLAFREGAREWGVPAAATVTALIATALGQMEAVSMPVAVLVVVAAALVGLLWLGVRPVLGPAGRADRPLVLSVGLAWLGVCLLPWGLRLFPGPALVESAPVTGPAALLPLRIPTGGHAQIDLVAEGQLDHTAEGIAVPVTFTLTVEDAAGPRILTGQFSETRTARRLGRRGSTLVHQAHVSQLYPLDAAAREAVTIGAATSEPATAPPITVSAHPHLLPSWPAAVGVGAALLGTALWLDRRPSLASTDGALTLATGGALGATWIFATDNAVHPGFGSLLGAAAFGGAAGLAAAALLRRTVDLLVPR